MGILLCLVGGWYVSVHQSVSRSPNDNLLKTEAGKTSESSSTAAKTIYVDVKGAVNQPGVYTLNRGLRVQDAVAKAGGVSPNADMNHVNMAKQVVDQQVVYVPSRGEVTTPLVGTESATGSMDASSETGPVVNLNTATKDDLMKITGIGDKKADLILQYRQEHGQFKTVDELKEVSGFGDKSVAKIKDQLAV